jgi:hypothetical protein
MMTFRKLLAAGAAATALFMAGAADAAIVFVGSWNLNEGVDDAPLAGREAAALIFGGDASDYLISTEGPDVGSINFRAWYAYIGLPDTVGVDLQDVNNSVGFDLSAYVNDPSLGEYVNYAFKDDGNVGGVPEPAIWALMIGGFGLTGAALRRRRTAAA